MMSPHLIFCLIAIICAATIVYVLIRYHHSKRLTLLRRHRRIVYVLTRYHQSKSHRWQVSAERKNLEAQQQQAKLQESIDTLQHQVNLLEEELRKEVRNETEKQNLQKQTADLQRQQMELLFKKIEVSELHAKITRILEDCHRVGHSHDCLTSDEWNYLLFVIDPQAKLLSKFSECGFTDKEMHYCCLLLSDYNTTERTFLLQIARATIYRTEERICKKMGIAYAPNRLKSVLQELLFTSGSTPL